MVEVVVNQFQHIRHNESDETLLPNCWFVVRVDGINFAGFTRQHWYDKPNDIRGSQLMNAAAEHVMQMLGDVVIAYGQSDEYSFLFPRHTKLYQRRKSKIVSVVASRFTSAFVHLWPRYFPSLALSALPAFDARAVLFATDADMRTYLCWRQADGHINNQYNTCFWNLVRRGDLTPVQAYEKLKGTQTAEKNELLFSLFSINYNDLPQIFRKGTTLIRNTKKNRAEFAAHCSEDTPTQPHTADAICTPADFDATTAATTSGSSSSSSSCSSISVNGISSISTSVNDSSNTSSGSSGSDATIDATIDATDAATSGATDAATSGSSTTGGGDMQKRCATLRLHVDLISPTGFWNCSDRFTKSCCVCQQQDDLPPAPADEAGREIIKRDRAVDEEEREGKRRASDVSEVMWTATDATERMLKEEQMQENQL
eukprot:GHVS01008065.1.p1 GENE.GHVS01008065.1~~GHVS01008065.1.p1  ORF type:complete len:428 (-),score=99.11 GHVS01008065.1:178-1461(-)